MAKSVILAAGFIDLTANGINDHTGQALLLQDERIAGFINVSDIPDDATVHDFSAAYCLPGLVDVGFLPGLIVYEDGSRPDRFGESVWRAKEACERWLAIGITSVASMGTADRMDMELSKSIAAGRMTGPRLYPALSPLVPMGASQFHKLYGVREITGADHARRATRELIKQGADRVVVYADVPLEFHMDPHETNRHRLTLSVDELAEIVFQADQAGAFVHAQAISTAAIDNCIQAGVQSIGCAFGLKEHHIPLMAEKGVALAPNLALGATIRDLGPNAGFSDAMINMVSKQRVSPDLLQSAHQAGVDIICATNTAFLAGDVIRECVELHRAGLSIEDTLHAATRSSARAIKPFVECGGFEENMHADFIITASDPTKDLSALSQIEHVIVAGEII
jgi:imidazolonepropionase-like amidohydrolase